MITYGSADDRVDVSDAYFLYEATCQQTELWIIEGVRHVEGLFLYPAEYEERLIGFFDAALK